MRPISPAVKKELLADPRMKSCALAPLQGLYEPCHGRVQFHHVWIYAGRQIDEPWAIQPACVHHHKLVESQRAVKMAFETASLLLAGEADLLKYPRRDWGQVRKALGLEVLC